MKAVLAVLTAALFLVLVGCISQPTTRGGAATNVTTGTGGTGVPADWCKPGTYAGGTAGAPAQGTVIGLATHNGKQMCHMTSTVTTQGMTITTDCYYDQVEMCCTMTGIPGVPATETCTPMQQ